MGKKSLLNFNSEIIELLKNNKINLTDGTSYLILLYYHLDPSYIPDKLSTLINSLGIFTKNYNTGEIIWNISLFEESEDNFEWVTDFMDKFKAVNPSRRGVKKDCLLRMKKLFRNNPDITPELVMRATDEYISTVNSPQYIKFSHKFIEEDGKVSMLLDFIERLKEKEEKGIISWL